MFSVREGWEGRSEEQCGKAGHACTHSLLLLPSSYTVMGSADRHVGHGLGDSDTLLSAVLPNTGLYQKIPKPFVELNGKEVNGSGKAFGQEIWIRILP